MFKVEEIEDLKNYFTPKVEYGSILPAIKDTSDGMIFFLKSGLVYIEHVMIKNSWYKKVVDSDSQVILEKVWKIKE